jgi:hypothetical protein
VLGRCDEHVALVHDLFWVIIVVLADNAGSRRA